MWFSLCLSVIPLRSVSCVFTIKIGLDWMDIWLARKGLDLIQIRYNNKPERNNRFFAYELTGLTVNKRSGLCYAIIFEK